MHGVGAHGGIVEIAGHGNISLPKDWLAGLQWKPLDISQVPNLHSVMQLLSRLQPLLPNGTKPLHFT